MFHSGRASRRRAPKRFTTTRGAPTAVLQSTRQRLIYGIAPAATCAPPEARSPCRHPQRTDAPHGHLRPGGRWAPETGRRRASVRPQGFDRSSIDNGGWDQRRSLDEVRKARRIGRRSCAHPVRVLVDRDDRAGGEHGGGAGTALRLLGSRNPAQWCVGGHRQDRHRAANERWRDGQRRADRERRQAADQPESTPRAASSAASSTSTSRTTP